MLALVAGPVARSSTRPRGAARPPMPGAAGAAAEEAAGPRDRYRAASRAAPSARGRERAASCCRWGLRGNKRFVATMPIEGWRQIQTANFGSFSTSAVLGKL